MKTKAEQRLSKDLNTRFTKKQNELWRFPAEMGDGLGNLTVDGMDGYIHVRIAGKPGKVFNNRVPNQIGTAVWVGYSAEEPTRLQVLSTRSSSPTGAETGYVGYAPARRYEWHAPRGGQDPLYVHLRAMTPLRLSVSDTEPDPGELLVNLYRGFVYSGSRYYAVARQDLDISAHVPSTTGKAAFVLITISNSGTVVQTKGDEVDIDALAITDIPDIPAGTVFVCGAVRVYQGQEKVMEGRTNTDFVDLRFTSAYGFDASTAFLLDPDPLMAADSNDVAPTQAAVIDYLAAQIPLQGADYFSRRFIKLADPTVDDDDYSGYQKLDIWLNQTTRAVFICADDSTGAAIWLPVGGGGGNLIFSVDGALAVTTSAAVPILIPNDVRVSRVWMYVEDPGTSGSTIADIILDDVSPVSIFSGVCDAPPELPYNHTSNWVSVVPTITDFIAGDVLKLDIPQVADGASTMLVLLELASAGGGGGGSFNLTVASAGGGVSASNVGKIVVPDDTLANDGGGQVTIYPFPNIEVLSISAASKTTTSASYVDHDAVNSILSFTKLLDDTDIKVDLSMSMYSTVANTGVWVGIHDGTSDHDVVEHFFNPANTNMFMTGIKKITGLAAGSYTLKIRWKRKSGTGTLTTVPEDRISLSAQEVQG